MYYSHPRIHSISYSQEDELFVSWMLLDWSMKTDWPVCHCDIAWHVTPVACIDCDWSILILWIGDHALVCSVYWKKACFSSIGDWLLISIQAIKTILRMVSTTKQIYHRIWKQLSNYTNELICLRLSEYCLIIP